MRWPLNIIAVLLVLAGGTFTLQGLNILLGSFMSGSTTWLVVGVVLLLAGVAVLFVNNRRSNRS